MAISVVIPVYNTSYFLKKCLDSVINQTYTNLEIICINDGSTDNSLEILKEYQLKDSRIKIIDQQNKGVSNARNSGVKEAKGEYISFLDSDDVIDKDYFEKMFNAITENNCDIAVSGMLRVREHSSKPRLKYEKIEVVETLKDKIKACKIPKCCYACGKLYKKSLIQDEPFREKVYFEDVLWTPNIIKKAAKIVTVPDVNYLYIVNSGSIVKKKPSQKKQNDSYNAKKFIVKFFEENNLELSKKEKNITKKLFYLFNFAFLKVKEYKTTETFLLFGFIPVFKRKIKTPVAKDNTFIVCELCSTSHSEVVPGFVKYLHDLGYHVSVLVHPNRYKEGLFSRFNLENVSFNKLNKKEIRQYFKNNSLDDVKGVMITTVGKICDCVHYEKAYEAFNSAVNRKKLLFVEHEAKAAAENNSWKEDLITLRKMDFKNIKSVVVNPHYFGDIKVLPKNDIVNFITVGAIKPNKMNSNMMVEGAKYLTGRGIENFKITVIGKGNLKHIPKEIRKYFDIKGRLPFKRMYDELEKADFLLMPYSEKNPEHIRYITSGTSGNFQLIYGFLKPCILIKSFAPINNFDENNAVLYEKDEDFSQAMETAVKMSKEDYSKMQNNLKNTVDGIYQSSKENLKNLIEKGADYNE